MWKKMYSKSVSIVLWHFNFSHTFKMLQHFLNRLKYINNFKITEENMNNECYDNDDNHNFDINYSYGIRKIGGLLNGTLYHQK